MRRYPTLEQFSQHVCTHWEMLEQGEGCVMFNKVLTDPSLHCNPQCPAYEPWDCTIDELLAEEFHVELNHLKEPLNEEV